MINDLFWSIFMVTGFLTLCAFGLGVLVGREWWKPTTKRVRNGKHKIRRRYAVR